MPCGPKKQRKSMSTNKKLGKKYQDGGMLEGLLEGPSHEEGGIKFEVGGVLQEAEGGEYVIKKEAAEKLGYKNLDYMNETGEIPIFDARKRSKNNAKSRR